MDENEFDVGGTKFYAKIHDANDCDGCALLSGDMCTEISAKCEWWKMSDGRNVIFVEKQQ